MTKSENIFLDEQQSDNLHTIRSNIDRVHTPQEAIERLCEGYARRSDSLCVGLTGDIKRFDGGRE